MLKHLTLVVPGLLWPDAPDRQQIGRELAAPALATLLGRGRISQPECGNAALLAELFGLKQLAPARLAALADGLPGDQDHWLLAEPAHLRVDRDRALLADSDILIIGQHEADAFIASLNQLFGEDGFMFHAPHPKRWYVQLPAATGASFSPLPDAVGENINQHLPSGEGGLLWSRYLNELQMLLYTHPANDEREARGEPSVNTVWLWGEGELVQPQRNGKVLSDSPLCQLLAHDADTPPFAYADLAEAAGAHDSVLVELEDMAGPAQYRDAWGWRQGLLALEERWFAPLLQALRKGQLQQLTLRVAGQPGLTLEVAAGDMWKFWRRARNPFAL